MQTPSPSTSKKMASTPSSTSITNPSKKLKADPKVTMRKKACIACHIRKKRCDAGKPVCKQCAVHGTSCSYEPLPLELTMQRRERRKQSDRRAFLAAQLARQQKPSCGSNGKVTATPVTPRPVPWLAPTLSSATGSTAGAPSTSTPSSKTSSTVSSPISTPALLMPTLASNSNSTAPSPLIIPSVFRRPSHPFALGASASTPSTPLTAPPMLGAATTGNGNGAPGSSSLLFDKLSSFTFDGQMSSWPKQPSSSSTPSRRQASSQKQQKQTAQGHAKEHTLEVASAAEMPPLLPPSLPMDALEQRSATAAAAFAAAAAALAENKKKQPQPTYYPVSVSTPNSPSILFTRSPLAQVFPPSSLPSASSTSSSPASSSVQEVEAAVASMTASPLDAATAAWTLKRPSTAPGLFCTNTEEGAASSSSASNASASLTANSSEVSTDAPTSASVSTTTAAGAPGSSSFMDELIASIMMESSNHSTSNSFSLDNTVASGSNYSPFTFPVHWTAAARLSISSCLDGAKLHPVSSFDLPLADNNTNNATFPAAGASTSSLNGAGLMGLGGIANYPTSTSSNTFSTSCLTDGTTTFYPFLTNHISLYDELQQQQQ